MSNLSRRQMLTVGAMGVTGAIATSQLEADAKSTPTAPAAKPTGRFAKKSS